jgi:hypothetical protein
MASAGFVLSNCISIVGNPARFLTLILLGGSGAWLLPPRASMIPRSARTTDDLET